MSERYLRDKELSVFKELWERNITIKDIKKVLPRLKSKTEHSIRLIAVKNSGKYYRSDEERPEQSDINETYLRELLKRPSRS